MPCGNTKERRLIQSSSPVRLVPWLPALGVKSNVAGFIDRLTSSPNYVGIPGTPVGRGTCKQVCRIGSISGGHNIKNNYHAY